MKRVMMTRDSLSIVCALFAIIIPSATVLGQGVDPYPHALTDRLIHPKTPMWPPRKNVVFVDPDFGSSMVRVTDANTNFKQPGTSVVSVGGDKNEWSSDSKKFYVEGKGGGEFVFGFDPQTMHIKSLPGAGQGLGLLLPLKPGPSFSFVDPDLIYGIDSQDRFTIISYRFSTGVSTPIIDTRTCGVEPPLDAGRLVQSDAISLSLDGRRISISEGGREFGKNMFVVVYDQHLGCRWYNTQTGQIGGRWATTGLASVTTPYLIRHTHLSRDGKYVRISTDRFGWYIWELSSLKVTPCANGSALECEGYSAMGYHTQINGPGVFDDMQTVKRPLNNLSQITPLFYPLPSPPGYWGQTVNFAWSNVDVNDSTPICGSTYSYDGDTIIDQPFAGEIFCMETDGHAFTVWRFAHDRAKWISAFYNTQPLGNVSRDGRFFLFNSDWDGQLGPASDGTPDSAVFIVKLN